MRLGDTATGRNVDKEEDEGLSSAACQHLQSGRRGISKEVCWKKQGIGSDSIGQIMPQSQINEN